MFEEKSKESTIIEAEAPKASIKAFPTSEGRKETKEGGFRKE